MASFKESRRAYQWALDCVAIDFDREGDTDFEGFACELAGNNEWVIHPRKAWELVASWREYDYDSFMAINETTFFPSTSPDIDTIMTVFAGEIINVLLYMAYDELS